MCCYLIHGESGARGSRIDALLLGRDLLEPGKWDPSPVTFPVAPEVSPLPAVSYMTSSSLLDPGELNSRSMRSSVEDLRSNNSQHSLELLHLEHLKSVISHSLRLDSEYRVRALELSTGAFRSTQKKYWTGGERKILLFIVPQLHNIASRGRSFRELASMQRPIWTFDLMHNREIGKAAYTASYISKAQLIW